VANVNDIKAGEYELLDLRWDEPTSKPGDPVFTFVRHEQGDIVKLDEENAKRLVLAGYVAPKGERQKAEAAAAAARFRASLAQVPDDVRAALLAEFGGDEAKVQKAVEDAQTAPEALTVHTAPGLVNEGNPRYAAAAHGEGNGGGDPQKPGKVKEDAAVGENAGDGRVDLGAGGVADSAVVSEDDGTKTTRNARRS
jgi:hypothetical protein